MGHDYAVYGAITGITLLASLALLLGASDGVLTAAIAALATLGGVKIAQATRPATHTDA